MGRINAEQYMKKLETVLNEKSTSQRDLWTSSYYVVDTAIYEIMADYIREKYFSYYSNEITDLIAEHKVLFKTCLNRLGIN